VRQLIDITQQHNPTVGPHIFAGLSLFPGNVVLYQALFYREIFKIFDSTRNWLCQCQGLPFFSPSHDIVHVPYSGGVLESTLFFTYVSHMALCLVVNVDFVSTWTS
jgi:hypothetical protein